jgi:DNA modification methylase
VRLTTTLDVFLKTPDTPSQIDNIGLELNRVYLGDCLELMREMHSFCIDTIVTDPPFFMPAEHYQSRKDYGGRRYSDCSVLKIFWDNILQEAVRILKPTGHLFVFCNSESYPVFFIPTYDKFHKCKSIIWDKKDGITFTVTKNK